MKLNIDLLQPYEYVLSERKLARIRWIDALGKMILNNPHVIPFGKRFIIVDGNHTTYFRYEQGQDEIDVVLEAPRETDSIGEIIGKGVMRISDLSDRILTHNEWRKIYPGMTCNPDDELSDEAFFRKYPEIEPFCSYRK